MYNTLLFLSIFVNFSFISAQIPQHNSTYIDKSDNILRVPAIAYDDQKTRRKYKKTPKSTIQKIIKRNRMKIKKLYVHQMTKPTLQPKPMGTFRTEPKLKDEQTTQANKRRQKKWNSKVVRNRTPFQNLQRNRFRRSLESDNLFVIRDLDEIEFLGKNNDSVTVNAHVKRYW